MSARALTGVAAQMALVSLTLLAPVPAEAATYTLIASRDSYLKSAGDSDNFGSSTELLVKTKSGDSLRAVYYFDLASIPANETVTLATVRFRVTQSASSAVRVHRITDSWTESGVTWSNTANDYDPTHDGEFTPSSSGTFASADITSLVQEWRSGTANHGVMLISTANDQESKYTSKEWSTSSQRPRLEITTTLAPSISASKTSVVESDPFNGTSNPKRIPGSAVRYTITVTNSGGSPDASSATITDPVPLGTKLFVGDLGGAGSGPVTFTDGSPSSGLTFTFTSLSSTTDSVAFSNDGGSTYTYTPVADADGCDSNVTHLRVTPSGTFNTDSSFQVQFRVRVE